MTPQDSATIAKWGAQQRALAITLATSAHNIGRRMDRFCDHLKAQATTLKVKKESDETGFIAPAMIVGRHKNIAFRVLPEGKLLKIFLETIELTTDESLKISGGTEQLLQQIDLPVALELYVAHQCPNCPAVLKQLLPMADANPHLRLTVMDAQLFEETALDNQIRSVPTLVLDDQFRWSGTMDLKEILTICLQRDPAQLSTDSLRQLIEDGQAQRVAAMMTNADAIFPALIELIIHERWSVRLGAMVTVEYLTDDAPHLTLQLAIRLWERFPRLSDPVKGDVLQVIGQAKSDVTRGYLNSVLSGAYDETVKEAAAEALEEME